MFFVAKIETPELTVANFVEALKAFARSEMRLAIKASLEAMLSRIPIRTGFLSGSFVKVAAKYGLAHNPVGFTSKPEYYRIGNLKVLKTESSGQDFIEDRFTENGTLFQFDLENSIIYWQINDLLQRGSGTPWLSLDAGRAAFLNQLSTASDRFPDINTLLGSVLVTVKSGSGSVEVVRKQRKRFNR